MKASYPFIREVRGKGLMVAVELSTPNAKDIVARCMDAGLLLNNTSETTLRFLPPLIVTEKEIDEAVSILKKVLS